LIDPSALQVPLLEYRTQLVALSHKLMAILARGLPFNSDPNLFGDFSTDPLAVVRLLHYPPQPDLNDPRQVGAGAHTDFGAITLLMQDSQGGLQVLHEATGIWIDVKPNPDAYVVNIGDMLQKWTDGEYKSNVHRVINKSGGHRYSVPFFFDGNLDYVLRPLNSGSNDEPGVTVEEFMKERYRRTMPEPKK
jgi:isopenicillin N synthase-like dioxygenase